LTAHAQTQGAATIQAQAQNATPTHQVACGGWGRWCPPGSHRVCSPMRCWCAPCWSPARPLRDDAAGPPLRAASCFCTQPSRRMQRLRRLRGAGL